MTPFTPGPWRVGVNLDNTDAVMAGETAAGPVIAFPVVTADRSIAEMHANATLIAAAPDMLVALASAVEDHESSCGYGCTCECIQLAAAALAKAGFP